MLSDVASLKVIDAFGLPLDAGTFIYPITFTLRDLVHKRLGARAARLTIVLAAGINLFMAGFFWLLTGLAAHPGWNVVIEGGSSMQQAFAAALVTTWAVVAASITAEVVSEFVDTEVYRWWVKRNGERRQWLRVLVSNAASVPLDSIIFCWIAGLWAWGMSAGDIWANVGLNVGVKMAVTLIGLPLIYLVGAKPGEAHPD
jgi:hypothetical protein